MNEDYILKEVFDERMKRVDDENDRQNHRITALEKTSETLNELVVSVRELAIATTNMQKELEKQGKRLEAIENEPAEKWKKFVWIVFTAVVGAVLGYLLAGI